MFSILRSSRVVAKQQFANARFQSSKSTNSTNYFKNAVATKVLKQKNEYNALSNQNLANAEEKKKLKSESGHSASKSAQPIVKKKKKIDYSKIPKAPQTTFIDDETLIIDSIVSGHKPLSIPKQKSNFVSSLEDNLKLFENLESCSIWPISPTGLKNYSDWDNVPYEVARQLNEVSPFVLEKRRQQELKEKVAERGRRRKYISKLSKTKKSNRVY